MPALTPRQALQVSVAVAILTTLLKGLAAWITGSVAFFSDALESLVNVTGAAFALAMVIYAQQPPDAEHPYGHGKAEYFSAAFEGGMIFLAALAILVSAAERIVHPRPIEALGWGTALAVLATLANLLVARLLLAAARTHRSIAAEADARHLMTDVFTTAGVIAGVALAVLTGHVWLDPLLAMLVALNILREGWRLLRRSVDGLMDHALNPAELASLEAALAACLVDGVHYVGLRTRKAGALRFAHVQVHVPGDWSVTRAHELADRVEAAAQAVGITLTTHIEPAQRR
ncbi:cation transporter [Verticiella sediminum]|uniref:Cation transporter n=1 Tax=Verticiella sediminum TaxID=1247510 RepID=A0A556A7D7_9BURK|nr:cation diffusion facilitator family transporter [Verticiella sediminum]TSH88800.1 cation transporter [Verticiella sediminum]